MGSDPIKYYIIIGCHYEHHHVPEEIQQIIYMKELTQWLDNETAHKRLY